MKNDLRSSYFYGLYLALLIPELVSLVKCFPHQNHFSQDPQNKLTMMSKKQEKANIFDKDQEMEMALKYKYLLDERNGPSDMTANSDRYYYPLEDRAILGEYLKTQKRDENQLQRGWGAGGLPFNALYMSNSFKPVSTRSEQVNSFPLSFQAQPRTEILPPPAPHTEELRAYRPPVQPPPKQKGSSRRFLTLPQLFLSYGWNSNHV